MRTVISIFLTLISLSACKPPANTHDHSGHGHSSAEEEHSHEPKIQAMAQSPQLELFVKFDPLLLNQRSLLELWVYDAQAQRPYAEDTVTLISEFEGASMKHPVKVSKTPGLFRPKLRWPKAGAWSLSVRAHIGDREQTLKLCEPVVYADPEAAAKAVLAPQGDIFLDMDQQWDLGIKTVAVEPRPLTQYLSVAGKVVLPPSQQAKVSAPAAGRFLAPRSGGSPKLGEWVEQGQVVARIQPLLTPSDRLDIAGAQLAQQSSTNERLSLQAQLEALIADYDGQLAQAEARVKSCVARCQLDAKRRARVASLVRQKAKSMKQLEAVEFDCRKSSTELELSQQRLKQLKATKARVQALLAGQPQPAGKPTAGDWSSYELRAPIAGLITHRPASLGEQVSGGQELFEIANLKTVWLEARVPESELTRLPTKPKAQLQFLGAPLRREPLATWQGRFLRRGTAIDARTRTLPVYFQLSNADQHFFEGQALTVFLAVGQRPRALAIPRTSVLEVNGERVVFVQRTGDSFEKRVLSLGLETGGPDEGAWVEVKSGLVAGERVVVREAYKLRLASAKSALGSHGHAH